MNIEYSKFQNNSVLNKVNRKGGSLYLLYNSIMNISHSLLSKCHASMGGAIAANSTKIIMSNTSVIANTGSAIYMLYGYSFEINNSAFLNNSANQDGGAILCSSYCVVKITNTKFSQNIALDRGGALCIDKMSKIIAHNCSFTDNTASQAGAISVIYSDNHISDSNFSHNTALGGGALHIQEGYLLLTNSHISNNAANGLGGVIYVARGTVIMSHCLVFNNTATANGGVLSVTEGTILLRNSSFITNVAGLSGGVLFVVESSVIHITKSFYFGNRAKYTSGLFYIQMNTKLVISETNISKNPAKGCGVLVIDTNSTLELNGSLVDRNNGETVAAGLCIFNDSLIVAVNSSFKGNMAYQYGIISIFNSTVYLEKCNFIENQVIYFGGIIYTSSLVTKLKVSRTVFTQNRGYDIFYFASRNFIFQTYRSLFLHSNVSLKSNVKNFEDIAVKENVIGRWPFLNQTLVFKPQETPYASSKLFDTLKIFIYLMNLDTLQPTL